MRFSSQNYGASQILLQDDDGAARELFAEAARHGLVIRPVYMPAAFHCEPCGGIATHKSCPHGAELHLEVTDEEITERLLQGEGLPSFAARPEIARTLARGMAERLDSVAIKSAGRHIYPHAAEVSSELRQSLAGHKACALWMTGLSGSGKSTIAHRLERDLLLGGHRVFVLDGDTLRHGLNHDLGFSEADRRENLRRAAEVVKVMVEAGLIVIASFISPFRAERQMVREILGASFREVYVEASLAACEERDPKGLYKRARAGQIPQFTGISSPYEPPENPDVRLDTTACLRWTSARARCATTSPTAACCAARAAIIAWPARSARRRAAVSESSRHHRAKENPMPIFMIGTQRSGSNLLRLMINQLPEVAAPHPPHILQRLMPMLSGYGDLKQNAGFMRLVDDVCQLVELNPVPWEGVQLDRQDVAFRCSERSLAAVFGAVYDIMAEARGAQTWCCKSLANIHYLNEIEHYLPRRCQVHLSVSRWPGRGREFPQGGSGRKAFLPHCQGVGRHPADRARHARTCRPKAFHQRAL